MVQPWEGELRYIDFEEDWLTRFLVCGKRRRAGSTNFTGNNGRHFAKTSVLS